MTAFGGSLLGHSFATAATASLVAPTPERPPFSTHVLLVQLHLNRTRAYGDGS